MAHPTNVPALDKSNVTYTHPDYGDMLPDWTVVSDCVKGQRQIKGKGEKYLPHPGSADPSNTVEHKARYESYKQRGIFYGVTGRTLNGLVGEVFSRDATFVLPKQVEDMLVNIDGEGRNMEQVGKEALGLVLGQGRAGLLADYPTLAEGQVATVAELQNGSIRPRLVLYRPEHIINWRTVAIGAKTLLKLVVIVEKNLETDDGFEERNTRQWRVLRLEPEGYTVQIFRENEHQTEVVEVAPPVVVLDASGKPMREIPFTFIGPTDNGPDPNLPPLLDLANVNIGHYINSAQYEDSVSIVGDPTLILSGVTEEWAEKVWKKGKVKFGCRSVIPLGVGATAELLQAEPNGLVKEAMESKERQMVALGAKLVEQREVQRTAKEAGMDETAKTSVLGSSARNVSAAITMGLKWFHSFIVAGGDDKIEYELNTDFDHTSIAPDQQQAIIAAYNADILSWEEVRWLFNKAGFAYLDDKEALKQIETDPLKEVIEDVPGLPPLAKKTPKAAAKPTA